VYADATVLMQWIAVYAMLECYASVCGFFLSFFLSFFLVSSFVVSFLSFLGMQRPRGEKGKMHVSISNSDLKKRRREKGSERGRGREEERGSEIVMGRN